MMSIAFKEGLKIPPQAMEQIIVGANQDVRQVRLTASLKYASSTDIFFRSQNIYSQIFCQTLKIELKVEQSIFHRVKTKRGLTLH